MKIEILCPEFCSQYGDSGNVKFLELAFPKAEFIKTNNTCRPAFVDSDVDMIYLGSMTEAKQELTLKRLMPYRDRLAELVESGKHILATGNAMELFGKEIRDREKVIECLGIFDFYAERDMENRINYNYLGISGEDKIVGTYSQFSYIYGDASYPLSKKIGGIGSNPESDTEGVYYKNTVLTYLLGPFLWLNPTFAKRYLEPLGLKGELPFEKHIMEATEFRLARLEEDGAKFSQNDHGW